MGDLEHDSLIGHRLAAYLAGRDGVVDLGAQTGVISEPYRLAPKQVAALDPADRQAFHDDVLVPLADLVNGLNQIVSQLGSAGLPTDDPWVAEVLDGIEVTYQRARFSTAVYSAAAAMGAGEPTQVWVAQADAALDAGRVVVARRHGRLHDPNPQQLLTHATNATTYPYGYLYYADQLCYWERERAQLGQLIGENVQVPSCFSVTLPTG